MVYKDREGAGFELAKHLTAYAGKQNVIVLGIPCGGVPVAFQVGAALHAPLDVYVVRKLGVPGQEELGFGAISSGGIRFTDPDIVRSAGISDLEIELITLAEGQEVQRQEIAFRGELPPLDLKGRVVILVDDGIATGGCIRSAVRSIRRMNPDRIVIAVPVAPHIICRHLRPLVDEFVCLQMPQTFAGVGEFYQDFSQVSDEAVQELLKRARRNGATGDVHAKKIKPEGIPL